MAPRTRNSELTTRALLDAARTEFAEVGYALAKTESIVGRAGLTRGALYHHFSDKLRLFDAVVCEILAEIDAEVAAAAATAATPFAAVRAGCARYLECCARDDVRRIVLVDGPAALGWERWQEIDESQAFDLTRRGLRAAMASGELVTAPVEPMTRALLGMVTQAGLDIGRSADPGLRRNELAAAIDLIFRRLSTTA